MKNEKELKGKQLEIDFTLNPKKQTSYVLKKNMFGYVMSNHKKDEGGSGSQNVYIHLLDSFDKKTKEQSSYWSDVSGSKIVKQITNAITDTFIEITDEKKTREIYQIYAKILKKINNYEK